jgi:hypothetical protein
MAEEIENSSETEGAEENRPTQPAGSNLPLIVILAALTIYFGFQTLQGLTERANLSTVKSNQDAAIQEAQKVQTQFKTLVTKTGQLADQGHAGAKLVMEELLKRGVGGAPEPGAPEAKASSQAEPKPTK